MASWAPSIVHLTVPVAAVFSIILILSDSGAANQCPLIALRTCLMAV